ncbi:MAG: hypothetical protein ACJAUT_000987 [Cellvibrionaceae bacterium]|jgi:hypothetical protein
MTLVSHFFTRLALFSASIAVLVPCVAANVSVLESCPQYQHPVNPADIIGMVRDVENGELLYCEYHVFDKNEDSQQVNKKTNVEYRALDQTLIATKSVDYSPGLVRPNVVQNDLRHNELRSSLDSSLNSEIITTAYEKKSAINVSYRKPNSDEIASITIELEEMLVIDAGFDEAVKEYWYTLTRGEKLIINFLSPLHLRTIKLTVKQSNTNNCYKEAYDRETQACFLIRPTNMVLNLFVKPLSLTYDLASKRLLRFKGDVNITDAQGDTQNAIIKYYYAS